jgi:hypothetical protein
MGNVARLRDDEDEKLINYAQTVGEANLSEDLQWRLQGVRDQRRRREAAAALQGASTDASSAQRLAAIEKQMALMDWLIREGVGEVIGESVGEERQRARAEVKTRLDEIRAEVNAKSDAMYSGFETACNQLRNEDRTAVLETVRETLVDAEARIDEHFEKALQAAWERAELEIALVRDEILGVVAEKQYGQLTDDAPKLELAEKAIAGLRKRMTSVEAEGARQAARNEQLAGMADQLAALEGEVRKATRSLLVRCAANVIAVKKERSRADELADKVERLEAELERLVGVLSDRKLID